MITAFAVLVFGFTINTASSQITTLADLDAELTTLLDEYFDKQSVIPKQDITSSISVNVQFSLSALKEVDIDAGQITISGYLTTTWTDERYTPTADAVSVMVPAASVWTPTLTLVNGVSSTTDSSKVQFTFNTAEMILKTWTYQTGTCRMNNFYFPLDVQECTFRYKSLEYSANRLVLTASSSVLDTTGFTESSEWSLKETFTNAFVESSTSYFQFTIKMKRKSVGIAMKIFVPTILIEVISIFCFLIPIQASDRTGFSVMCILVVFLVYLFNSPQIPSTSTSLPLILYFLFTELFFSALVSLIVILSVWIGSRSDQENVPDWLSTFVGFLRCNFNARELNTKTRKTDIIVISDFDQEIQDNKPRQNGGFRMQPVTPESAWDDDINLEPAGTSGSAEPLNTVEKSECLTWKEVGKTLDYLFLSLLLFFQICICC